MVDLQLAIADAADDDEDAWILTQLAVRWGRRLPKLAVLKQFKDGVEMVDSASVPAGMAPSAAPVYRTLREIGTLNLARRISESVTDRQRPNGFRKISNRKAKDADADGMYKQCRLDTLLRCRMFPDVGDYGTAYAIVSDAIGPQCIRPLSPWTCYMDADEESAITYGYDEQGGVEHLTLYRIRRDKQTGELSKVYAHRAFRESERTVVDIADDDAVRKLADEGKPWTPGNMWQWEDGVQELKYAALCDSLPIVRLRTPDMQGLFEPHLDTLRRIDRQIFDRLCITMMQAFRQRAIEGDVEQTYGPEDIEVIQGLKQEGDPIDLSERYAMGPAALWNLPDGVSIWESQTTDLNGLQNVINADIRNLAATAGIPLDILSPDVQGSANGAELKRETLKFKVENLNALAAESITRMVRMALVASGESDADNRDFELTWKPMVSTSSLELAQAAQLQYQSGLMARRTVLTRTYGFTAQDVAEDDMNRMADQLTFTQPATGSTPPLTGAAAPATGWDENTQSAIGAGTVSDDVTGLDGMETF